MLKMEFDWPKASKTKFHPQAEKVYRKEISRYLY